ncbi:MAG: tetratricopeptide repeat protein [Promethearchaeota archaeon]|nr:MAG: tetratricopeptide repeat protein [Candidatus Lokiarchaeota archaeon]
MGKNIEKQLKKAEQLYKAMQYKRAAKLFNTVGGSFLNLGDYELAKHCFFNAAKSAINEDKYLSGLEFLRNAGNAALFNNNFSEAFQFFKEALKYIPSLKSSSDRNYLFILFSTLSYLCLFVEGKQEEGLSLVKKTKAYVDNTYFKENILIKLIKDLTIATKDKNENYIKKIEQEFVEFKFHDGEIILTKRVLVLAKTIVSLITQLTLDKKIYTTNDTINLTIDINTKPLLNITKDTFYDYSIKELKITKIGLQLSDNFTVPKKPELPITITSGHSHQINLLIKPHFQIEKPYIGPILLTSELDGILKFFYEFSEILYPNLISPPPSLDISIKSLKPPLIGQTFPLEFLIENKSEGEALDLNIEVEFPENLKVMRGTLKKQIYSLRSNENMKWEINLKPLEAGDYSIKIKATFKDPDQNQIGEIKEFPLSIKL